VVVRAAVASTKKNKEKQSTAAGKGKKAEMEQIAEDVGPPPPHPGSAEWQFVDRPIDVVRRTYELLLSRYQWLVVTPGFCVNNSSKCL